MAPVSGACAMNLNNVLQWETVCLMCQCLNWFDCKLSNPADELFGILCLCVINVMWQLVTAIRSVQYVKTANSQLEDVFVGLTSKVINVTFVVLTTRSWLLPNTAYRLPHPVCGTVEHVDEDANV